MRRMVFATLTLGVIIAIAVSFFAPSERTNFSKPSVVATLFPLYDFARFIGGDEIEVVQLIPPGADVHAFALSPRTVQLIFNADLFLYCGNGIEPWSEPLVNALREQEAVHPLSADCTAGIGLRGKAADCGDCGHDHGAEAGFDPHVWTDPVLAAEIAVRVGAALMRADSPHAEYYSERTAILRDEIMKLHTQFQAMTDSAIRRTVVYCGHSAFAHAAERYKLHFQRAYQGMSSNEQSSPILIQSMISAVRQDSIPVIFAEENVRPRLAEQVAKGSGVPILVLHGIHNVTHEEVARGESWLSLMRQNLVNLRRGLY